MRKTVLLVLLVIFLFGCEQVICSEPYIRVGTDCCLDEDNNKICDKDETIEESSTIIISEPKIVERKVYEYVCADGSIVDVTSKCPIEEVDEPPTIVIPHLENTNEENTVIETVTFRPACISGINGGEIFFRSGTIPTRIKVQAKEVDSEYEEFFTKAGLFEGYIQFAICDKCYKGAFKLEPDKVYIVRLEFDQRAIYDRLEYSNEHLVDTREDSEFMTKTCS